MSQHIGLEIKETTLLVIGLISWNFRVAVITMGLLTVDCLMRSSQLSGRGEAVGGEGGGVTEANTGKLC